MTHRSGRAAVLVLFVILALGGVLVLPGCMATAPSTAPPVPAYMEHVPGTSHGTVLLVGRTTCPWCMKTKELLGDMNVDYYWVDLSTLDEANTTQLLGAIGFCGQVSSVPVLVINNRPPCIIGYQEETIREALR